MRLAYYGSKISENIVETPEGFIICKNVPIGRIGDMQYSRSELMLDGNPDELVTVHRDEGDVFDVATIASFEGKSVTDNHPNEDVVPDNYANYEKGHAQNVRRGTGDESGYLVADLFVKDPMLINEIINNVRREVSCGYACEYDENKDGTFSQRQIRGNHVAIVENGRAGKSVCIKDSVPTLETPKRKERNSMKSKKGKGKDSKSSILSLFARSVRDAKTDDEIEEIIEDAEEALDCSGKDEGGEGTPSKDEGDPKDSYPTRDELAELIDAACAKAVKTAMDEMNAGKAEDDDPDELIAELIEELTGDSNETEDNSEQEEALTVSAESMDGDETEDSDNSGLGSVATADNSAAIQILKNARPAIAKIKDKAERKRVTDALIKSVRVQTGDSSKQTTAKIMRTTAAVAKKRATDSMKAATIDIEAAQSAYDSRNPHKKEVT
jgi:hypothetical protein